MARRISESIIGLILLAVGIYIAIKIDTRGDVLVIFFVALGGFLVSKSLVIEFFKSVWGAVRGYKG